MYSRVVVPPTEEPVDLERVKSHLRVMHTAEDLLISGYVAAARDHVEQITRRSLMPQTREVTLGGWGRGPIRLTGAPVRAIVSVTYVNAAGETETMGADAYELDTDAEPGTIRPAFGRSWPAVRAGTRAAVRIRYQAGYESSEAVPQGIVHAILLLVGHWYANRETVVVGTIAQDVPITVTALLGPHRIYEFA